MTDNLVARIWAKDGAAWTDDPGAQQMIPTALGWLDLADQMSQQAPMLDLLASDVRQAGYQDVFLLGMGGSSLCPEVLWQTFGARPGHPALTVLDTTNPDTIHAAEQRVDLTKTLFLVSSKSGGTIESTSLMQYFFERVKALRGQRAGEQFIALTDPGTNLTRMAMERGFWRILPTPPEVGGRYSALTYFGLVPAALLGLDLQDFLARAQAMSRACSPSTPADQNPGLQLGLRLGLLALEGRDKVTLVVPPAISSFGLWVEQLLAESTGKQGGGLIPIAGEPLGPPAAYGDDRVFIYLSVDAFPDQALERGVAELETAGQPVIRLRLREPLDLAGEFFRWEFATAVAGTVLRINAFDQPNVQESKDNTSAVLAEYLKSGALPTVPAASESDLPRFLQQAAAGDYVAIMAYLPYAEEVDDALRGLRTAIRDGLQVATTVGYGPRFLHSTGQLHKGGPNTGLFVQIVASPSANFPIPGEPYDYGTLFRAQSIGDFQSLTTHGRRALRLDLGTDWPAGLDRLRTAVDSVLANIPSPVRGRG